MMETKHTKGEWKYQLVSGKKNSHIMVTIPKHPSFSVYQLDKEDDCGVNTCGCISEEWANAKLITAAPDLLKALIMVYEAAKNVNLDIPPSNLEVIKNAIKKATE